MLLDFCYFEKEKNNNNNNSGARRRRRRDALAVQGWRPRPEGVQPGVPIPERRRTRSLWACYACARAQENNVGVPRLASRASSPNGFIHTPPRAARCASDRVREAASMTEETVTLLLGRDPNVGLEGARELTLSAARRCRASSTARPPSTACPLASTARPMAVLAFFSYISTGPPTEWTGGPQRLQSHFA